MQPAPETNLIYHRTFDVTAPGRSPVRRTMIAVSCHVHKLAVLIKTVKSPISNQSLRLRVNIALVILQFNCIERPVPYSRLAHDSVHKTSPLREAHVEAIHIIPSQINCCLSGRSHLAFNLPVHIEHQIRSVINNRKMIPLLCVELALGSHGGASSCILELVFLT